MKEQSFRDIKRHTFCGKSYKLSWVNPGEFLNEEGKMAKADGLCQDPKAPDKTITIDPDIHEKDLLATALDEGIHACLWELNNDFVDDMSNSLSEFLWRMGFRLNKKGQE